MTPKRVLIVDDSPTIRALIRTKLAADPRIVVVGEASDPFEAREKIKALSPDVLTLDVEMPRMNGLELLQRLRDRSALPVIFLTSKDGEPDEALGLALGADDYIAKPFSQRLLVARIRAILRRADLVRGEAEVLEAAAPAAEVLVRGRLEMDPTRHRVVWSGEPVSLTVTEFLILEALAQRPGVIKNRNQLMDAAYSDDVFVDDRTIDSHIKRLRRKFRAVDPQFAAIETLYGAGYSFADG